MSGKCVGALLQCFPDNFSFTKRLHIFLYKHAIDISANQIWYHPGNTVVTELWTVVENGGINKTYHTEHCSEQPYWTQTDKFYIIHVKHFCNFFIPDESFGYAPVKWFYTMFKSPNIKYKLLNVTLYFVKLTTEILMTIYLHCSDRGPLEYMIKEDLPYYKYREPIILPANVQFGDIKLEEKTLPWRNRIPTAVWQSICHQPNGHWMDVSIPLENTVLTLIISQVTRDETHQEVAVIPDVTLKLNAVFAVTPMVKKQTPVPPKRTSAKSIFFDEHLQSNKDDGDRLDNVTNRYVNDIDNQLDESYDDTQNGTRDLKCPRNVGKGRIQMSQQQNGEIRTGYQHTGQKKYTENGSTTTGAGENERNSEFGDSETPIIHTRCNRKQEDIDINEKYLPWQADTHSRRMTPLQSFDNGENSFYNVISEALHNGKPLKSLPTNASHYSQEIVFAPVTIYNGANHGNRVGNHSDLCGQPSLSIPTELRQKVKQVLEHSEEGAALVPAEKEFNDLMRKPMNDTVMEEWEELLHMLGEREERRKLQEWLSYAYIISDYKFDQLAQRITEPKRLAANLGVPFDVAQNLQRSISDRSEVNLDILHRWRRQTIAEHCTCEHLKQMTEELRSALRSMGRQDLTNVARQYEFKGKQEAGDSDILPIRS